MLAIERLQQVLHKVVRVVRRENKGEQIVSIVSEAIKSDGPDGFLNILHLLTDAVEEVATCEFRREERRDIYTRKLRDLREDLCASLASASPSNLRAWFYSAMSEVDVISAAVTEALDADTYELDRPAFIAHTQELIADISDWPIDEYAKRNLLLSMNMVCHQAQAEAVAASDAEVRRKIKSIVASFAIEFAEIDKEFETRWEKIRRWARLGYNGASTPLGLTADASAVVGLLPKP